MPRIEVDANRCKACYLCVSACPKKCLGKSKTISKKGQVSLFEYKLPMRLKSLQEIPSGIELQPVPSEKEVMELPGTFYYDPDKKTILVHYAALEQKGVSVYRRRVGIRIHGSYIHLENLNFSYYREPI